MKSTKDLHKGFWERHTPVNISKASVKLFRENTDAVIISMPSKTTACGYEVKKVTNIHEIRECGSTAVVEDSPSLITREKCFIEITYENPWYIS